MNKATTQYLRALKQALKLCGSTRRHLLQKFQGILEAFLEEQPNPTTDDLQAAFGSPAGMAQVLLTEVPEAARARYRLRTRLLKTAAILAAVFVVLFAVYTFWLKEIPVYSQDYAVVYSQDTPVKEMLP